VLQILFIHVNIQVTASTNVRQVDDTCHTVRDAWFQTLLPTVFDVMKPIPKTGTRKPVQVSFMKQSNALTVWTRFLYQKKSVLNCMTHLQETGTGFLVPVFCTGFWIVCHGFLDSVSQDQLQKQSLSGYSSFHFTVCLKHPELLNKNYKSAIICQN